VVEEACRDGRLVEERELHSDVEERGLGRAQVTLRASLEGIEIERQKAVSQVFEPSTMQDARKHQVRTVQPIHGKKKEDREVRRA
jgi:hypothetical protein